MKKIVLAFSFSILALTGHSSLKGSILVNTVSFADLPDKPQSKPNKVITVKKLKPVASKCTAKVNTTVNTRVTCLVKTRCFGSTVNG